MRLNSFMNFFMLQIYEYIFKISRQVSKKNGKGRKI